MKALIILGSILAATLITSFLGTARSTDPAIALHAMPCADMNGDGEVTPSDLELVWIYFGQSVPPAPPQVDLNSDSVIDLFNDIFGVGLVIGTTTACQDTPIRGPGSFPAAAGDDVFPSMGQFRVVIAPKHRPLMVGYPGYDGISALTSPVMNDANTIVGRSAPHLDGDASDTSGASVGTAGTSIADSTFSLAPPGFQGPAGTREVHTEVRTLNLSVGGAAVRAGTAAPGRPISPGEVESYSSSGDPADDWPAESFFDIFVELDLPAFASFPGATLYNDEPLLVSNTKLQSMPPTVVYIHNNTSAVPVLFSTTNPGVWAAGDLFGYMVLAGHGAGFSPGSPLWNQSLFEDIMVDVEADVGELPPPDGDSDGCADGYEVETAAGTEQFGGRRSPSNPYDFYDTNGDQQIDFVNDIVAVALLFGADADNDPPGEPDGYDPALDRSAPLPGDDPWDMQAPDGQIDLVTDVFGVAFQFGHNCT